MIAKIQSPSYQIESSFNPIKIGAGPARAEYNAETDEIIFHQIDGTEIKGDTLEMMYHLLELNGQMDIKKTPDLGYFEKLNNSIKDGRKSEHKISLTCILDDGQLIGYAYIIDIALTNCAYVTQIKTIDNNGCLVDVAQQIISDIFEYHEADTIYIMGGESQCKTLHDELTFDYAKIYEFRARRASPLEEILAHRISVPHNVCMLRIVSEY